MAAIRNQAAQHIDKEVRDITMARMLNLGDVLELINDGFNNADVNLMCRKIERKRPLVSAVG
jgi:hypothetical protein